MSSIRPSLLASLLASASATSAFYTPPVLTSWQITLSAPIAAPFPNVSAVDTDLFDTPASTISALVNQSHSPICYFSAGSAENWRPDYSSFLPSDLGSPLDGWPGEKWVNTSSPNVRKIMSARMDLAVQKGCVAVDPDNTDAYDNGGGGFSLTQATAIDYVNFLASEAHKRGLGVGLKNSGDIIPKVINNVDFSVNEQCVQYKECSTYAPFVKAGKPVFGIEYVTGTPALASAQVQKICNDKSRAGMSTLVKHMSLDAWMVACPGTLPWPAESGAAAGNTTSSAVSMTTTKKTTSAASSTATSASATPSANKAPGRKQGKLGKLRATKLRNSPKAAHH